MGYDSRVHYLGKLCRNGHGFEETGESVRYKSTKTCTTCSNNRARRDRSKHRDARAAYQRAYTEANRELYRAAFKRYREKHRDKLQGPEKKAERAAYYKRYCKENAERLARYKAEYYKANRDRYIKYALSVKEHRKAYMKKYMAMYSEANAARLKEMSRQYFESPEGQESARRNRFKRRATLAQAVRVEFGAADVAERLGIFGDCCAYCGAAGKLALDHFFPLARGGHDAAYNIVPACKACNSRKRDRPPVSWYMAQPYFKHERLALILDVCLIAGST